MKTPRCTTTQVMLTNISVKFHDSRSNPFWAMSKTSLKLQILIKSRAITPHIMNKSINKHPVAQLHMLFNMSRN
jgi:hypothetical protein